MGEKEPRPKKRSRPIVSDGPYLGIDPKFTHNRGGAEEPNSGPEHNPVLERDFPWPDLPKEPNNKKTNQQGKEE